MCSSPERIAPDSVQAISLVTPQSSAAALVAALSQDPDLTSLPHQKADIVAPRELTHTTGTAEIFRSREIQSKITGDFIIVPCDLFCELDGELLIESWLAEQRLSRNATSGPDVFDQTRSYLAARLVLTHSSFKTPFCMYVRYAKRHLARPGGPATPYRHCA